jgi:hypothetical protein
MEFASRTKRAYFMGMLLGLVPDAVLACLLAAFFDGGVAGFVLAFLGLQLAYLILWVKASVWAWLLFSIGGRKRTAGALFDVLAKQGFPEPDEYHHSADSYFMAIADNNDAPIPLRLAAMSNATTFFLLGQEGRFQDSLRLSMAYEDALIQLKRLRGSSRDLASRGSPS